MIHDRIGDRMKTYEATAQHYLVRRTPVIIRVDGKAFHSFTKHLQKPFDTIFQQAMQNTMKRMCENIQNCVIGYQQSDEITFCLVDYETLETDAWFSYRTDKLCSIAASMATMYFNQEFRRLAEREIWDYKTGMVPQSMEIQQRVHEYHEVLRNCIQRGGMFDARCFNIPKEEVTNCFYWRQLDAMRNSVLSVGQANYSHRQLQGASCAVIKEMLKQDNKPWENLPIYLQRGTACIKDENGWYLDFEMPILKDEDRSYIDNLVLI